MSKKIKMKTTSGSGSLFATWEQCEHWELLFFFCNILQLSNDSNDWSRSCHFHGSPGTVGGGTHGARAAGGLVLVLVLSSAPVALI